MSFMSRPEKIAVCGPFCVRHVSPQSWPEWEEDISGGYVLEPRSVDLAQPHAALPGIPLKVWLKVAMDELRHRPEEGIVKETLHRTSQRNGSDRRSKMIELRERA